ncbi:acriflavin resistance protein [Salinibacter sp. 10B]|nr:acriflavin resistance protein [Salinibacter sp. 10B]
MRMNWLQRWIERPVPVLAWAIALLLGGGWMATQVPLEWAPTVELPEVRVSASWPGSSPRAVERYVTAPLERAVQNVEGTAGVESVSQEGQTTVTAQVAEGTDLSLYTTRISERLRLVEETLPDRVSPRLTKRVPEALRDEQGFMTLQLVGPQAPSALRRWADDRISPRLSSLPGVSDLRVRGGTTRELLVTLDPDRLAAQGIEAAAAQRALRDATTNAVYGRLRAKGRAPLLLTPATDQVGELRTLVVSSPTRTGPPVELHQVATIERTPAPRRSITRIDGDPVVTLTLDRAPGSHMVEVAERVRARMGRMEDTLPPDARLEVATDKSEDVRRQLRNLRWRGGIGLLLVVLVLLLMLRSVRAVGAVLFTVSVALAVALALLEPLGLTLNLITLAGLVLVFGLLVDNSVIVTEQLLLERERRPGVPLGPTAATAVRAVALPLVGGTITTIAVMLPLVYLSGELRTLFLPFGILTALTLAASLVSAALLVPVLGRWLPPPVRGVRLPRWMRRLVQWPYALGTWAPKTTMIAVLLLVGVPTWLLPATIGVSANGDASVPVQRLAPLYNQTVGSDLVQEAREWIDPALGGVVRPFIQQTNFGEQWDYQADPEVYVRLGFPPGNPIQRADSLLRRFEQTALASSSVRRTVVRISERSARLRVLFRKPALETSEPYILRERLIQEAVLLAGIDVSVGGLLPQGYYSRSGTNISGFTVTAYGPNYEDLSALCERFARELKQASRRVAAVNTNAGRYGYRQPREVLRFRLGTDAQARTGVTPQRIARRLQPVLSTRHPSLWADLEGAPQLPVRIVVDGAPQLDVETFTDRPLVLAGSTQVKLKSAASYEVETVPSRIVREDQQYKRYIEVDYRGPHRMGDAFLDEALKGFSTPPGYRLERDQSSFFTEETERTFGWVILGTIVLVFLATAAVFESWRLPGVVLLSVPTALVGVAVAFLLAGDLAFAEGAFIGAVLLVGIAANDSILLVDRYRTLRSTYAHAVPKRIGALVRLALRERLRPMWTTTLSTCVAMLPLLVFPQEGEFWTGMAVTVTGGLLTATLLAPLATVALVPLLDR